MRDLTAGTALAHAPEVAPESAASAAAAARAAAPRGADEPAERYPRSKFLELSTLGLGGVIGGIVTAPALGFMVAPAFLKQGEKDHDLGPLTDYPEGKYVVATYMADPAQGEVSRRTAFVRNNGQLEGPAELHDHLEPLRAPRLPGAAERAARREGHEAVRAT